MISLPRQWILTMSQEVDPELGDEVIVMEWEDGVVQGERWYVLEKYCEDTDTFLCNPVTIH